MSLNLRSEFGRLLRKTPALKRTIKIALFKAWLIKATIQSINSDLDPSEVCFVDPNRISNFVTLGKNVYKDTCKILGGDWDLRSRPLSEKPEFRAFAERFNKQKEWKETEFYRIQAEKIRSGNERFGCKTVSEFEDRLLKIDALFHRIKYKGYKSQSELSRVGENYLTGMDEVMISVGRNGEPLFTEGRHRLAIAKLLGLKRIPVKITIRHKEWYEFRKKLLLRYCNNKRGKLYNPVTHFDFARFPSVHGDTRIQLIRENLPLTRGTVLDIGSHLGYFCHRLEEEGFDCYAVESDVTHFYFLKKLRDAEGRRFNVINSSIFDYTEGSKFDVILALNIFYHFLKARDTYYNLISLLERLEAKYLFLQTHTYDEHVRISRYAYKTYSASEFVEFVIKHSKFNDARCLGADKDGRALYCLYRNPPAI